MMNDLDLAVISAAVRFAHADRQYDYWQEMADRHPDRAVVRDLAAKWEELRWQALDAILAAVDALEARRG